MKKTRNELSIPAASRVTVDSHVYSVANIGIESRQDCRGHTKMPSNLKFPVKLRDRVTGVDQQEYAGGDALAINQK